ncbi:MAG TPA: hypothetical protein VLC08_12380, partial [Chitinolyticbacter sp.]|nr:hypothetical protein [Chitinolyticbacter sp.]
MMRLNVMRMNRWLIAAVTALVITAAAFSVAAASAWRTESAPALSEAEIGALEILRPQPISVGGP